jgi:raffinose/stachyose/melibiose transport system substrate-binding protein
MFSPALRYALSVATIVSGLFAFTGSAPAAELTFWSMWNDLEPQAKALQTIMSNYTKAHPETTFKAVWNGRQNQTKLRGALQAGTSVDFMDQDGDQLAGGLQKEGLGYQLDGEVDDAFKGAFLPGAFDIYSAGGKHYQIPYIYNTVNFWYNKDMMKEAGAQPPKTWTDLIAICAAVKKLDKHALVIESNNADYNLLYFSQLLERALGSGVVMKLFEDKSGAGWSNPAVLAAAKRERELWDADCIAKDARGFQWPAGQQTIALGETMGELVGSWLPSELLDSAGKDFPWGAFNFPDVEGGAGKSTDLQVALLSMMVLKNSPHAKEAVSFLKYLMSEEAQKVLVDQGFVGVTRKGVAWPAVLSDAYNSASNATALSNFAGGLNLNHADFYSTVFKPEHNKMFLGQTTPEQFVETMVAKTKEYWAANP